MWITLSKRERVNEKSFYGVNAVHRRYTCGFVSVIDRLSFYFLSVFYLTNFFSCSHDDDY